MFVDQHGVRAEVITVDHGDGRAPRAQIVVTSPLGVVLCRTRDPAEALRHLDTATTVEVIEFPRARRYGPGRLTAI